MDYRTKYKIPLFHNTTTNDNIHEILFIHRKKWLMRSNHSIIWRQNLNTSLHNIWLIYDSILDGVLMNIYDFDGTIYDGDSSIDFFKYCIHKNKKCLLILPKFLLSILLYIIKIKDKEYLKSCFYNNCRSRISNRKNK